MTERACGPDAIQPVERHAALVGSARPTHRLSLAGMQVARQVIDPVFLDSPQFECEPLSKVLGCRLTIKFEFSNPIRSFKGGGASWLIHSIHQQSPKDDRPIVSASAGNWGQAIEGVVDDVAQVQDQHIIEAMLLLYQHAGLLVEPAGAAGVAASLANPMQHQGQSIGTPLCGSNLTQSQIRQWIDP